MATAASKLSVEEFERQYGGEKPYYEYWHGDAIQKPMAFGLHGSLQVILGGLLRESGYKAASEVTLKIDPDFRPIPDIIATRGRIETQYATRPLEIVIEILSENDLMSRILTKCRCYATWGFEQIYVIDPPSRTIFRWHSHRLEEVNELAGIPSARIWSALDQELS